MSTPRNLGRSSDALDRSRRPFAAWLIAEIDELHRRLRLVVAVSATADDGWQRLNRRRGRASCPFH
jgi:hypothetical protein